MFSNISYCTMLIPSIFAIPVFDGRFSETLSPADHLDHNKATSRQGTENLFGNGNESHNEGNGSTDIIGSSCIKDSFSPSTKFNMTADRRDCGAKA